jgi:oligo-1,6-glucosidase
MKTEWYKDRVFYQIWPRSFKDGNGDGIGDLYGVCEKLGYLKDLGIGGIWFSPFYPSPNADFGYDVSDYYDISPEYGDLEIFKKVLEKAHELDMKVILDLVICHTSDEHEWFRQSREKDSPYRDFYFWRKGKKEGKAPNNWSSFFSRGAWSFDPGSGEHYLHLHHSKQVDLNMDNPRVREEVKKIMRFWLDMGVDGFREDVITYISKHQDLPDDFFFQAVKGMRFYDCGPRIHEYLQEFRTGVLDRYDCFTVGEAPMISPKKALSFVSGPHPDLDMVFGFQHMEADCLYKEYLPLPFSLRKLKRAFTRWQKALNGRAWNALYLENHDHPRVVSRYGSEKYHDESAKMLAACFLLQQGTPFIFQGQELGMTNFALPDISMYEDCVAKKIYEGAARFLPKKAVLKIVQRATRDNSRSPFQWSGEKNAGFSEGEPWFYVNENYKSINAADEAEDPASVLNFYRALIHFRTGSEIVRDGDYRELMPGSRRLYVYERRLGERILLVVCSFSAKPCRFSFPKDLRGRKGRLLFCNYEEPAELKDTDGPAAADGPGAPDGRKALGGTAKAPDAVTTEASGFTARPYEARVYEF